MKYFLSIDWDYFINASSLEREVYFPDGREYEEDSICDFIWSTKYGFLSSNKQCDTDLKRGKHSPLLDIDVDYNKLRELRSLIDEIILRHSSDPEFYVRITESHLDAFYFVGPLTKPEDTFKVVNIDYHHDLYAYDGSLNCGNWVKKLKEFRPNMIYEWVRRNDSETIVEDLPEGFEYTITESWDSVFSKEFLDNCAGIFICKSSMWSPPHLDPYLVRLVTRVINKFPRSIVSPAITVSRKYEVNEGINFFDELQMLSRLYQKYHK